MVPLLGPIGLVAMVAMVASFLMGGFILNDPRRTSRFSTLVATALIVFPMAAIATVSVPYSFNNGEIANATEVNANFDVLTEAVNHRTIPRATGLGPADGIDAGVIVSRTLSVNKDRADTALRIGYTDNFRVWQPSGAPGACRWQVLVDGASCPGGALVYDRYIGSPGGTNVHAQAHVVGYCEGLAAGPHTIEVEVTNTLAGAPADCYTGYSASRWVIESEEVF